MFTIDDTFKWAAIADVDASPLLGSGRKLERSARWLYVSDMVLTPSNELVALCIFLHDAFLLRMPQDSPRHISMEDESDTHQRLGVGLRCIDGKVLSNDDYFLGEGREVDGYWRTWSPAKQGSCSNDYGLYFAHFDDELYTSPRFPSFDKFRFSPSGKRFAMIGDFSHNLWVASTNPEEFKNRITLEHCNKTKPTLELSYIALSDFKGRNLGGLFDVIFLDDDTILFPTSSYGPKEPRSLMQAIVHPARLEIVEVFTGFQHRPYVICGNPNTVYVALNVAGKSQDPIYHQQHYLTLDVVKLVKK